MFSTLLYYITGYNSNVPVAPPIQELSPLEKEIKEFKFKTALGRNMPKIKNEDFEIIKISDVYIKDILSVKLKHIEVPPRKNNWKPRHPVLCEILSTVPIAT
jgi:hypothetical protein